MAMRVVSWKMQSTVVLFDAIYRRLLFRTSQPRSYTITLDVVVQIRCLTRLLLWLISLLHILLQATFPRVQKRLLSRVRPSISSSPRLSVRLTRESTLLAFATFLGVSMFPALQDVANVKHRENQEKVRIGDNGYRMHFVEYFLTIKRITIEIDCSRPKRRGTRLRFAR